ncbi:MAG: cache domain-containing protein [Candidatus Nitrosopolaris sp.]
MLSIKSYRRKDSVISLALISSLAGIAFMTTILPCYINGVTNKASITTNNNNTTTATATTTNNLITNILAKNLENHLQKAEAILEITSKLPQIRNVSSAHLLNQTLHGVPQSADMEKRQVAKDIIASNSSLYKIFFIMPNGDMYLLEPYSIQQTLTVNNYAFRDYFQGAIKTNDIYVGNVIVAKAASGGREAVIAVPVYSIKDNSAIVGVWGGSIDFGILNKELQSLKMPSGERVVYTGYKGQKVADSDITKSKIPESFANLNSFKNAINGQSGSTIDTVNNKKMLVTYQPVKVFHNTWVVLLMMI